MPPCCDRVATGTRAPCASDPGCRGSRALRGLVVAAVVGYHALRLVLEPPRRQLGRHRRRSGGGRARARLGVDAFFVLAGFLVVGSWAAAVPPARLDAASGGRRLRAPAGLADPAALPRRWSPSSSPWSAPELLGSGDGRADLAAAADPPAVPRSGSAGPGQPADLVAHDRGPLLRPGAGRRLARARASACGPSSLPTLALAVWWAHTDVRGDLAAGLLPGRLDQFVLGAGGRRPLPRRPERGRRSRLRRLLDAPRAPLPALLAAFVAVGTYHGATCPAGADVAPPAAWCIRTAGLVLAGSRSCGSPAADPVRCLRPPAGCVWLGGISFSLYLWHYPILDRGLAQLRPPPADRPRGAWSHSAWCSAPSPPRVVLHRVVEVPAARRRRGRRRSPTGPRARTSS